MPVSAVVDASALIAIAFDEPQGSVVADRLRDRRLLAPSLLQYELANVTLMKARRGGDVAVLARQMERALSTSVDLYGIDALAVLDLAITTGLTAYDAAYLWLAETFEAELVTLDSRLMAAAAARTEGAG